MPKVVKKTVVAKPATNAKIASKKVSNKKTGKTPPDTVETPITTKNGRPIVYEEGHVKVFQGDEALTVEKAKQLLGWREAKVDEEPLLVDDYGKKIVCTNNRNNRPYYIQNADAIKQEVLRGRWRMNWENLIIGETGNVLSGQHRLIGFILAVQTWEQSPEDYPHWEVIPSLEIAIAFGCSEDEDVINTIDTGKSRNLTDVLYRSEYFREFKPSDRKFVARTADFAVKTLWERTGVKDAFSLHRTHAESLDFIKRHPKLLDCVKHVFEENTEGRIQKYAKSLGTAAGFMYLMAVSNSDWLVYKEQRNESCLNLDNWDKASEFWLAIGNKDKKFNLLHRAVVDLAQHNSPNLEYQTLLIKAWLLFSADKPFTEANLAMKYNLDEDGVRFLIEFPLLGGIDAGPHEEVEEVEPTPEQVETEKAKVKQEKGNPIQVSDHVYIQEGEVWWSGVLKEMINTNAGKVARVLVDKGFAGAGKLQDVHSSRLSREKPE